MDDADDGTAAADADAQDASTADDDATEFSDRTLEAMVREVRPEWSLREVTPAEEGTDAVYFASVETPDGPRECVLKACAFLDPAEFRPEPHLMRAVERRTSIPVPSVVAAVDDHADLPAPFFLMERRAGEVRENGASELPGDAVERIARDAGRYLGQLHALGDFERFGPVRLAADAECAAENAEHPAEDAERPAKYTERPADAGRGGGLAIGDRTLTVGDGGHDAWRDRFEGFADFSFGNLHDRFADLESPLRAFVDDRLDALDREFPAVLGHDDYRLGNLLVDPATGETRAVLDWGNANTLEARYNLVLTEQYLSGWALRDDPLRERVRTALREGYRETSEVGLGSDSDSERRRDLYLAVTRLFPLAWFSLWYGDAPEAEREAVARRHRQAVRELLE
jgi:aminoglycoside phosphotransferase (APT) family kinase protein